MTQAVAATSTKQRFSSPGAKVGGAAFAAAVAAIFWTVAAATFWKGTFTDSTLAGLTGSSGTVLAFIVGYLVPSSDN